MDPDRPEPPGPAGAAGGGGLSVSQRVRRVLADAGITDPREIAAWFASPHPALGGRAPRELITGDDADAVIDAALLCVSIRAVTAAVLAPGARTPDIVVPDAPAKPSAT